MIASLLAELLPWAIGCAAVVLGLLGYGRAKKAEARKETYIETLEDSADRQRRGRDAVSDLRGNSRADDLEQLRRNNAEW